MTVVVTAAGDVEVETLAEAGCGDCDSAGVVILGASAGVVVWSVGVLGFVIAANAGFGMVGSDGNLSSALFLTLCSPSSDAGCIVSRETLGRLATGLFASWGNAGRFARAVWTVRRYGLTLASCCRSEKAISGVSGCAGSDGETLRGPATGRSGFCLSFAMA